LKQASYQKLNEETLQRILQIINFLAIVEIKTKKHGRPDERS